MSDDECGDLLESPEVLLGQKATELLLLLGIESAGRPAALSLGVGQARLFFLFHLASHS